MDKDIAVTEPALVRGTATAVVSAAITLLVSFGFNLSEAQTLAIVGFVGTIAPLLSSYLIRGKVTPAAQVAVKVNASGELVAADAIAAKNGAPVDVYVDPIDEEPETEDVVEDDPL